MKVYDAPIMSTPVGCIVFVRPGSRVLEFGPGTGFATRYMRDVLHCSVTCVEYSAEAAEKARQYAEKMIVSNIETDNWAGQLEGRFDFIIFGDVLEHLRDPRLAVEQSMKFLSPRGSILTSVPNIGHNALLLNLYKGSFPYRDFGLLDNTHIHFFTREGLSGMFASLGLRSVASQDNIVRPCFTEFNAHYFRHLLFSLCILRRKDGHVYQFVDEWKIAQPDENPARGSRLSLLQAVYELVYDCVHLLFVSLPESAQKRLKARFLR